MNKKTIESLIKAGAFDKFGNRASLLVSMPDIVCKATEEKKQTSEGQGSLFDVIDETYLRCSFKSKENSNNDDIEDFTPIEKLAFEKEFLGFYLTAHPQMGNLQDYITHATHEIELLEGKRKELSSK